MARVNLTDAYVKALRCKPGRNVTRFVILMFEASSFA